MPKNIYCAACGKELLLFRKAVKGQILDLVSPHECEGSIDKVEIKDQTIEPIQEKKDLDKLFSGFDFAKKVNQLPSTGLKDTRPDDQIKKPEKITSSAPAGVLDQIKTISGTSGGK